VVSSRPLLRFRRLPWCAEIAEGTSQSQKYVTNGRTLGTVQWFSRVKGYGFIRPDGQEEDIFVHYSAIRGEGYRNLSQGQRVEFTVEDTPKGPQAVNVVGLETGESESGQQAEFAVGDTLEESQAVDVIGLDAGESKSTKAYV